MKISSAKKKTFTASHKFIVCRIISPTLIRGRGLSLKCCYLPNTFVHVCSLLSQKKKKKKKQMETILAHPKDLGQTKSTSRQASFRFSSKNNI